MKHPVISLLTDFGCSDHYVGTMKGVMLGICPGVQPIDITHDIPAYAIAEAAYTLAQAWRYFPDGTVHLVVVDPGVGSSRRPIIAEAEGHLFVAPDNGVLTMIFDAVKNCRVREITASGFFRQPVSQTFHGRDIFAPVAAHLARGVAPGRFGKRIHDPVRAGFCRPIQKGPKRWTGSILKVDTFGNLVTNFDSETWRLLAVTPFRMKINKHSISRMVSNYASAEPDELFVIEGSSGYLEISAKQRSARDHTHCSTRTPIDLLLL
jgi:S-adenosyl-L-methionine hydrolase (adenosine-forming)